MTLCQKSIYLTNLTWVSTIQNTPSPLSTFYEVLTTTKNFKKWDSRPWSGQMRCSRATDLAEKYAAHAHSRHFSTWRRGENNHPAASHPPASQMDDHPPEGGGGAFARDVYAKIYIAGGLMGLGPIVSAFALSDPPPLFCILKPHIRTPPPPPTAA